jgi:hypothetical protein
MASCVSSVCSMPSFNLPSDAARVSYGLKEKMEEVRGYLIKVHNISFNEVISSLVSRTNQIEYIIEKKRKNIVPQSKHRMHNI